MRKTSRLVKVVSGYVLLGFMLIGAYDVTNAITKRL